MRNKELIADFINGATEGKGSNLRIEGRKLINYATVIAYRLEGNGMLLNGENYSSTTTVHQNVIRRHYNESSLLVEVPTEDEFNQFVRKLEGK